MSPPHVIPQIDIHSQLRELVAIGERLELTTNFQGITLSHQVSKIIIEQDCAHFISSSQINRLQPGQLVYFHHPTLPRSVVATIENVDWTTGRITTSHFDFSDHIFQARERERVQPGHPIRAILAMSHKSLSTCVSDISEAGIGLLIYHVKEKNMAFEQNHGVKIGVRLPNSNTPFLLSGTITRLCQIGNSAMASLGIRVTPTEKQARQLKSYIQSRQTEIYDEIANTVYRTLADPIETKNQYF